jgi:outer membrane protein OmpA-like peptidoglycan-associated protein
MTRTSILISTAILLVIALPQRSPSAPAEDGIRLAQAPTPPADEKDKDKNKRPPGQRPAQGTPPGQQQPGQQRPPAANVPPNRPAPGAAQPAPQQQRPGTPPAAAQTPPNQAPHIAPPAQAQTPPNQPPRGAPPAAAQTLPGQQPPRPGAPPQPNPAPPALANPNLAPRPPQAPAPAAQAPMAPQHPLAPAAVANAPVDPKSVPQHLDQLRSQRQQTQQGNQTVIREADRVIIREGGHDIIRHDEAGRFRFNAREVNTERHGNDTVTVVLRPDGSRIVTEVDETGRLIRRVRRDPAGREVIIIDNTFEPRGPGVAGFFVELPPPVVRIPRELYVRETARASAEDIFLTLVAPPVDRIERRYALDEIRYSEPLRERMPRVDIDTVNFELGSWEITPDQAERLAFVGQGISRAIQRNPREVFMVEGYTDATGNDIDNLSLSDRRAESVAVMLTNQFGVPPENLTTQGYGKQFLKIPTDAPERANRRVAVRRITPLLMGQN